MSSGSSSASEALTGTVAYHNTYIMLHTRVPPPSFASKVHSKLQRALQLRTTRWGGIVNHAWLPEDHITPTTETAAPEWDGPEEESYRVSAFSTHRGLLEVPKLSMENIDEVASTLQRHSEMPPGNIDTLATSPIYFYVCTHGERDCRCGETGGAVFNVLREEIDKHGFGDQMKVGAVGHVGGHKYAANVLVFPYGDWLGNVKPENVSDIVHRIHRITGKLSFDPENSAPIYDVPFWRGRMGLDKEEQRALAGLDDPEAIAEARGPLSPHPTRS